MSRAEFIDECIDCGKKIHNSDCRFFLCPECREKEKRIPLWTEAYHQTPTLKVFDMDAKLVVKNNNIYVVVKTMCDGEETTQQVNSKQLREFADYLDYNTKLARINNGKS